MGQFLWQKFNYELGWVAHDCHEIFCSYSELISCYHQSDETCNYFRADTNCLCAIARYDTVNYCVAL